MTTRALTHSVPVTAVLTLEVISVRDTGPRLDVITLANLTPILFCLLALAGWLNWQWRRAARQASYVTGWLADVTTAASFTLIVFTVVLKSVLWAGGVRV